MIKITIEAEDANDARRDLLTLAGMMGGDVAPAAESPKPAAPSRSRKTTAATAETPAASNAGPVSASPEASDDTDRELLEEVPPAPNGAAQVVDAGTGKPAGQQVVEATAVETKTMSMEEVRAAAAKLAQSNTAELKKILDKYGAPNLSGVPQDKLGNFAADVLKAIG